MNIFRFLGDMTHLLSIIVRHSKLRTTLPLALEYSLYIVHVH
jgi:hypothetical protein